MPLSETSKGTALIIGADGLLGRALAAALSASGWDVITTTRRTQEVSKQNLYLDLSGDVNAWIPPPNVDAAFLCAAVTSLAACKKNPEQSAHINIGNTCLLAEKLSGAGAFVVFPSTNLVFDGATPRCPANAAINPRTEYGRQKARAEHGILSMNNAAVVRFTKIVQPEMPLVLRWIHDLKNGRPIHPFSDMVFSPVSIAHAIEILVKAAETKLKGITQVSADADISYAELARHIADRLGVSRDFVQPVRAVDSEIEIESVPAHTTLDTSRIEKELGIPTPRAWDTVDSVFQLKLTS